MSAVPDPDGQRVRESCSRPHHRTKRPAPCAAPLLAAASTGTSWRWSARSPSPHCCPPADRPPPSPEGPRPAPSPCSSSSTAPGSPPARRWTGCATGGSISPSWPAPSSLFPLLGLAARGLVPYVLTPAALHRAAVPVPGALHHPVLDRLHLDRPRQRRGGDLRGLLLQPRRHRRHAAAGGAASCTADGGGFSADSLLRIVSSCWCRSWPGSCCAAGSAGSSPATRRSSAMSTAARSCSSSTPPSARAWSRASGTRSPPLRLLCLLGVEAVLLAVMLTAHLVRLEAARLRP